MTRAELRKNAWVAHMLNMGWPPAMYTSDGQEALRAAAEEEGKTPTELHAILLAECNRSD